MELQRALTQIDDIRRQMGLTRQFRGFRAATTLFTGAAALAAGLWQSWQLPDAANYPARFVCLWVGVAAVCAGACGAEIVRRYRRCDSSSQRELTRSAVEQFLPFVLVGGLLTLVLCQHAVEADWMLPGLWQILFGLGLLSLRHLSPEPIRFVGAFYILCGLANLSGGAAHVSPWCMGVPFGAGQTASALILYWYLERRHAA
ncbi:MAG: hypothetical protein ABSH08_05035 [Tepidisphaeraceae bacterium]|jgi:hypothetical protein